MNSLFGVAILSHGHVDTVEAGKSDHVDDGSAEDKVRLGESDEREQVQELDGGYVGEALVVGHVALVGHEEEVGEREADDNERERLVVVDERPDDRLPVEKRREAFETFVAVDAVARGEEERPVGEVEVTRVTRAQNLVAQNDDTVEARGHHAHFEDRRGHLETMPWRHLIASEIKTLSFILGQINNKLEF